MAAGWLSGQLRVLPAVRRNFEPHLGHVPSSLEPDRILICKWVFALLASSWLMWPGVWPLHCGCFYHSDLGCG